MSSLPAANFERARLTFSLEGFSPREEVLFKSLVRLLDHITSQKWIYQPASADHRVDLLVVSEGHRPTFFKRAQAVAQPVLWVGSGPERDMVCSWPLQPHKLGNALNRIGGQAVTHQASSGSESFMPVQTMADRDASQVFRLRQWPPSRFLVGTGRMRMATLLVGRDMSLSELQQRSALPLALCRAFTTELQKTDLLVVTVRELAVQPPRAVEPHEVLNLPSAAVAFAKPSLFARIRAGLGIKSSHNT